MSRAAAAVSVAVAVAVGLVGCAGNEASDRPLADTDSGTIEGGVITDADPPVTTVPISGSATELLPDMASEMSRLSAQIADDGDENVTLGRIEGIWVVILPEIESARPELVGGIQTTVDLARSAVDRKRPADADKAFSLLTDLVDNFTGDG